VHATVVEHDGHRVPLRCSIGVSACLPGAEERPAQLVQAADAALYVAKARGRGRVEYLVGMRDPGAGSVEAVAPPAQSVPPIGAKSRSLPRRQARPTG